MHNSTINEYCKAAKDQAYPKITNQDICDKTNISDSTLNNFFRGATKNPSVYLVGDICKALDVSLDEYFKLNSEQAPDLVEKIRVLEEASHKLEKENHALQLQLVELSGSLEMANAEIKHQKETTAMLQTQLANRRPVIYTLMCSCAVMAFTLLVYIILDANMPDVGFIRYGRPSAAAWAVIAVIAAATIIIAWSIIRAVRKPKKVKQ